MRRWARAVVTWLPCFDALPADLSPADRAAAGDFIHKYAHVFSKSEFDLGRTSLIPHKIDTGQSRPFKQPLRRHPRVHEQYIDEQVELMLQHDIIEPRPWGVGQ